MMNPYGLTDQQEKELVDAANKFRELGFKFKIPECEIMGIPLSWPLAKAFEDIGYARGKKDGINAVMKAAQQIVADNK